MMNDEVTEMKLKKKLGKEFLDWLNPDSLTIDERNLKIAKLVEPTRSKHYSEVSEKHRALVYGWAVCAVSNALYKSKRHYYNNMLWTYTPQIEYLLRMLRSPKYSKHSMWKVFYIWKRSVGRINVLHQMQRLGIIGQDAFMDTRRVRDMTAALGKGNDPKLGVATLNRAQQIQYAVHHMASMPVVEYDPAVHAQEDDDPHPYFD